VFAGKGGYHYATLTYNSSGAHPGFAAGCVRCHMPDMTGNGNFPSHSFDAKLTSCQSQGCHATATNFDINGMQTTVKAALAELQALLNTAGYLTRETLANGPLTVDELGDGNYELDESRPHEPPLSLDADTAGALWNYMIVAKGSGLGVHNPLYVRELLFDSISKLKGSAPTSIPVRP
jgi:hypothetical protein